MEQYQRYSSRSQISGDLVPEISIDMPSSSDNGNHPVYYDSNRQQQEQDHQQQHYNNRSTYPQQNDHVNMLQPPRQQQQHLIETNQYLAHSAEDPHHQQQQQHHPQRQQHHQHHNNRYYSEQRVLQQQEQQHGEILTGQRRPMDHSPPRRAPQPHSHHPPRPPSQEQSYHHPSHSRPTPPQDNQRYNHTRYSQSHPPVIRTSSPHPPHPHHQQRNRFQTSPSIPPQGEELHLEDLIAGTGGANNNNDHRPLQPLEDFHYSLSRPVALYHQQQQSPQQQHQPQQQDHDQGILIDIHSHPAPRCPPLNLEFMYRLYHQRHINIILPPTTSRHHDGDNDNNNIINRLLPEVREERISTLNSQGFPNGLATLIIEHSIKSPIRIWLIDNCGTMHKSDGHMVSQSSQGKVDVINCTRWEEITSTIIWHAEMAAWQQTPTAIRLLQDPGAQVGPQQVGVSASKHYSSIEEVTRIKALLKKTRPVGAASPINLHLQELLPSIQSMVPLLQATKTQLTLCICTDSIPTDSDGNEYPSMINNEFKRSLQELVNFGPNKNLIHIIWRLSTDEERVVQFYRNLISSTTTNNDNFDNNEDEDYNNGDDQVLLKDHITVLDDYVSECEQVQTNNPWLNYGYPLHLCREEGIRHALLDALSERPIETNELCELIQLIFGQQQQQQQEEVEQESSTSSSGIISCATKDYNKFRKEVELLNKETGVLWNPVQKKFVPWINMKKLDRHVANNNTRQKKKEKNRMSQQQAAQNDHQPPLRALKSKLKLSSIIGWR